MSKVPFYKYSQTSANHEDDLESWRNSHYENVACKRFIDSDKTGLSATAFDGFHVDKGYASKVIAEFGYQRTMCVLASTIHHLKHDGRFSPENKKWAEQTLGYMDRVQTKDYICNTHAGLVDILARNVRQEYDKLGLYAAEHCEENSSDMDYKNKVLVIRPSKLNEDYWSPENQIFYANGGGFGCDPTASGRAVYGQYLSDGEETRRNRQDFIGVMIDEHIPDWTREKLQELQSPSQEQSGGMTMT